MGTSRGAAFVEEHAMAVMGYIPAAAAKPLQAHYWGWPELGFRVSQVLPNKPSSLARLVCGLRVSTAGSSSLAHATHGIVTLSGMSDYQDEGFRQRGREG